MDLKTEPAKLRVAAERLENAADAISSHLRQLEQASSTLTTLWEGEAKVAYEALYGSFNNAASAHARALETIAGALAKLADEYTATDEKGAAAIPR